MKEIYLSALIIIMSTNFSRAQNVNIADSNFLQILINTGVDTSGDGIIQASEAAAITNLSISNSGISNLAGIEAFINLDSLDCSSNQLGNLDLSQNKKLTTLYCSINKLTSLNLSENTVLQNISCSNNKLASLLVPDKPELIQLDCGFNKLTKLDLSFAPNLEILECYSNLLDSLDLSENANLTSLYCGNNNIHSLDLYENIKLKLIDCQFNSLNAINLSNNTELTYLACFSNQLPSLDLSNNLKLAHLDCGQNLFTSLDLSKNDSLFVADCSQNPNLQFICVSDTSSVISNQNFLKDNVAEWTEDCNPPTQIDKDQKLSKVELNPNPGYDYFNLTLQQPANIVIFNSSGMEVEHFIRMQNLQFGQGYPAGLYLVQVLFQQNNCRKVLKIVKW